MARENFKFKYIRMPPEQFDHHLHLVQSEIGKQYKVRPPIPAEERLARTLQYVANVDSKQSITYQFRMENLLLTTLLMKYVMLFGTH